VPGKLRRPCKAWPHALLSCCCCLYAWCACDGHQPSAAAAWQCSMQHNRALEQILKASAWFCRSVHKRQASHMQQLKQRVPAALILLLAVSCLCHTHSAAAQRRQLTQASWKSQFFSLAVTVEGPCTSAGYPADIGVTFADCARKDAERLSNVLVARVIKSGVQGAAAGACLTRKVGSCLGPRHLSKNHLQLPLLYCWV
jgi:hypothetical protein